MNGTVLVLGGGPDAERGVSLRSAAAVAEGLRSEGMTVRERTIAETGCGGDELRSMSGDVVFPVLHGPWGEGGPMQRLLEEDGRPFVGSGSAAAAVAMDKLVTKEAAAAIGVRTPAAVTLDRGALCDAVATGVSPVGLPAVVKPIAEGSSVGLRVCRDAAAWRDAIKMVRADSDSFGGRRRFMVEAMVVGREVTVGFAPAAMFDQSVEADRLRALPVVEVCPASGVYDHAAKYERADTGYAVGPELDRSLHEWSGGTVDRLVGLARMVVKAIGVRHVARVDFIVPEACWTRGEGPELLELNTMPGFTAASLLPMAAQEAGVTFGRLCHGLVEAAAADAR